MDRGQQLSERQLRKRDSDWSAAVAIRRAHVSVRGGQIVDSRLRNMAVSTIFLFLSSARYLKKR
jgi:hypothetical protein